MAASRFQEPIDMFSFPPTNSCTPINNNRNLEGKQKKSTSISKNEVESKPSSLEPKTNSHEINQRQMKHIKTLEEVKQITSKVRYRKFRS
jgi:hypothetical protein